jgi:hypothetical protein
MTGTTCPKCQHARRSEAESCARCGLVFALWSPDQAADVVRLDEQGEALWAAAQESWRDEDRHAAFLKHCSQSGLLAPAGRRYRERLDADPQDAVAARMQQKILSMATASFVHPSKAAAPVTRTTWFWALLVACGIVGLLAAFLLR